MIKISTMTGKLEGFRAINFNPLDNTFCESMAKVEGAVCSFCYSRKALKSYRSACCKPWENNARIMKELIPNQELPRFGVGEKVRLLAHGELEDAVQAFNFIRIAKANPESIFSIWTKRPSLFDSFYIPDNFIIIQSSILIGQAELVEDMNPAHKVFTVYEKIEDMPIDTFFCKGKKCGDCMFCYSRQTGTQISEVIRK